MSEKVWLKTEHDGIIFENSKIGRMKKGLLEAPMAGIDAILDEYGIPSPSELGTPNTYYQNTPRAHVVEERRKNDVVFIPVGTTECHGDYANSGLDIFNVTSIVEGLRRFIKNRDGAGPCIIQPPLWYGAHPYHHIGMAGSIIIPDEVVKEVMINVMLGLWNDGFRKQIFVNNHGQLWVLEAAIQEFGKRYQLPGIYRVVDWHRSVRELFAPVGGDDMLETPFIHADEAEASGALLMFPEMLDMSKAVDTEIESLVPGGHFDVSTDTYQRPLRWEQGQGHSKIEIRGTPEGVVGYATKGSAQKAKRAIAAILKYLTLSHDEILEEFPAGTQPKVEDVTLRDPKEMEPFLKEPMSPGWKSVYSLPLLGQIK